MKNAKSSALKKLMTTSNTKTAKSVEFGYLTYILHLAPAKLSGHNVCPKASKGCTNACLNESGLAKFEGPQNARKEKTLYYFNERESFMAQLEREIFSAIKKAKKLNLKLAIRLNGTSDLPVLALAMAKKFPDVTFYDYTKIAKTLDRELPENYHLTFSRSESNQKEVETLIKKGVNVAVVFDELPKTYMGKKVINGDIHDLRFLDPKGVIVGLIEKEKAKKDESGFVVRTKTVTPKVKKTKAKEVKTFYAEVAGRVVLQNEKGKVLKVLPEGVTLEYV